MPVRKKSKIESYYNVKAEDYDETFRNADFIFVQ
jgi:hypothetical protein